MESNQQNYYDDSVEHASNTPPGSPHISDARVGEEYQVKVPSMIEESEWFRLLVNPADSEIMGDNSLSFAIGLPLSVTWMHNEAYLADIDGTVYVIELTKEINLQKNNISDNEEELKLISF